MHSERLLLLLGRTGFPAPTVHPKVVSEQLGHASIGITLDTYSHVLPTLQQEAAHAFDALFADRADAD